MSEPLSPWRWVRRALAIGLAMVVVGWIVGLLGALWQPWAGMVVGALGVFLGGGSWAASRLGGAHRFRIQEFGSNSRLLRAS